eukprot:scaffold1535_cov382-Prasinococcus_capsulatus_cf.AAC.5
MMFLLSNRVALGQTLAVRTRLVVHCAPVSPHIAEKGRIGSAAVTTARTYCGRKWEAARIARISPALTRLSKVSHSRKDTSAFTYRVYSSLCLPLDSRWSMFLRV